MTLDDLRAFENVVRSRYPKLEIKFKDRSLTQKVLGYLLFPFNPTFMTRYTTTFAPAVYFPTQTSYENNPKSSITVLAHELVHLLDTQESPFWFRFSYLFPQILSPVGFAAYVWLAGRNSWPLAVLLVGALCSMLIARVSMAAFFVVLSSVLVGSGALSVMFSGWASAALFAGFALLAPWPAPARVYWEQRGYAMSLALYQWTYGSVPQVLRTSVAQCFTGPAYFFMSWRAPSIDRWVETTVGRVQSGDLVKDDPYLLVYEFIQRRGLER